MSNSFEDIYETLRSDPLFAEVEVAAAEQQAEEATEEQKQPSTPKQARRRTEGNKAITPRSNRAALLAKPEMTRAPKRPAHMEEGSLDEFIGKRSNFELGPKVVDARTKLEEQLKEARQRIEELATGKKAGFELKFHEPQELEDKIGMAKTNRDYRSKQADAQLERDGVRRDPRADATFEQRKYLFLGPRGDLHFYMCPRCVEFCMNDRGKVMEMGGGYQMVTVVLCPRCVRGNNELNAARKEHFPTNYEMMKGLEQRK